MQIPSYICYTDFEYINYQAYSSTCNFLSPILVIHKFFDGKQKKQTNQKRQKSICKRKLVFFTLNLPLLARDETCFKLQRYGENIGDKKLPV